MEKDIKEKSVSGRMDDVLSKRFVNVLLFA